MMVEIRLRPHRAILRHLPEHATLSSCQSLRMLLSCQLPNKCARHKTVRYLCRSGSTTIELQCIGSCLDLVECEDGTQIWADVTANYTRILVLTSLQRVVFDHMHRISHRGVKASMALIRGTYWWQGTAKNITKWTRSFEACQKAKVHVHTKAALAQLPAPTKRFSHLHIRLRRPAQSSL